MTKARKSLWFSKCWLLFAIGLPVAGLSCDRSKTPKADTPKASQAPAAVPNTAKPSTPQSQDAAETGSARDVVQNEDRPVLSTSDSAPVVPRTVPKDVSADLSPARSTVAKPPERLPDTNAATSLPDPETLSPAAREIPRIDLIGLPAALRTDIEAAYSAACASPDKPDLLGELGMLYFAADSHLAAVPCFKKARQLDPNSLRWCYYLGLAALEAYDDDLAKDAFESALKVDSQYAPIMIELADLLRTGDPSRAQDLYTRAIEVSPNDARAHLGLGECAMAAKDYSAARTHLAQSLKLSLNYAAANGAMARLLKATGEDEHAQSFLELERAGAKAPLANDPLLVDLLGKAPGGDDLLVLAERLSRAGRIDDGIVLLRNATQRNSTDVSARHALGVLLTAKGRFAEAVQEYRAVLEKNPYHLNTIVDLAQALSRLGNYSEAEQLLRDILSGNANDVRASMLYGHLLLQVGRCSDAGRYYEGLVKAQPNIAELHLRLSQAMVCMKKYDVAVKEYRRWRDLSGKGQSGPRDYVWQLIRLLADQRRAEVASTQVSQLLQLSQLTELAHAFETGGMSDASKACAAHLELIAANAARFAAFGAYREAERIAQVGLIDHKHGEPKVVALLREHAMSSPDVPGVRHILASTLSAAGDKQAAASEWRQLVTAAPSFELAYLAWAIDLMDAKRYKETQELLREGLKNNPDSPLLANALAWALAAPDDESARNGEEAVAWATKACEATGYQDPELLDTLAAAHSTAGNYSRASTVQQDAIKLATRIGLTTPLATFRKRLASYDKKIPIYEISQSSSN